MTDQLPKQLNIPRPKGITIEHDGDTLKISRRSMSYRRVLPILAIALGADVLIGIALFDQDGMVLGAEIPPLWVIAICPVTLVGILFTYFSVVGLLNKTVITMTPQILQIKHSPLLMIPSKRFNLANVEQLYSTKKAYYELHIVMKDGRDEVALQLFEANQALYLEQEIEQFLGLKDQRRSQESKDSHFTEVWQGWKA